MIWNIRLDKALTGVGDEEDLFEGDESDELEEV